MQAGARRLLLIRHAHADAAAGQGDRKRVLNERGRAAATALGRWIAQEGFAIDRLVVSPAARTLETAELIRAELEHAATIEERPSLYLAPPRALSACVRDCEPTTSTLAIVAHNPGIWEFAGALADRCGARVDGFSPATCVVVEFEGAWADFDRLALRVVEQRRG
jgi:phosphohistidine phosphatase